MKHRSKIVLMVLGLALFLSACLPQTRRPTALESAAAQDVERTAVIAFHRMQLGFWESGIYNTEVLIDLALPQGVQWTLVDFELGTYQLRFSSEQVPEFLWFVSPDGVRVTPITQTLTNS